MRIPKIRFSYYTLVLAIVVLIILTPAIYAFDIFEYFDLIETIIFYLLLIATIIGYLIIKQPEKHEKKE